MSRLIGLKKQEMSLDNLLYEKFESFIAEDSQLTKLYLVRCFKWQFRINKIRI